MTGDNNKPAEVGPFFNYVTNEYEQRALPLFYDDARVYIPQTHAAQNMFRAYEKKGMPLFDALVRTLLTCWIASAKKKGDG